MTTETDAVIFIRRETWRKALDALRDYQRCYVHEELQQVLAAAMVELRDAARADGVTFDKTSP